MGLVFRISRRWAIRADGQISVDTTKTERQVSPFAKNQQPASAGGPTPQERKIIACGVFRGFPL